MSKFRSPRTTPEVRRFQRAAHLRFEEAQFLFEHGYNTAAVYLGGYAVECALKSLILSNEPVVRQWATVRSFRGTRAHDFRWLKQELMRRKVSLPPDAMKHFSRVSWWTTDLRYAPGEIESFLAESFLLSVQELLIWAEGK